MEDILMPSGKGSYGSKRGRPSKKSKSKNNSSSKKRKRG